jgi:hypothetical protein
MEYLVSKRYLVSIKEQLVLPKEFGSAFEAIEYSKSHGLKERGYNVVMNGRDVKRTMDSGKIKEAPVLYEPGSTNGGRVAPQTMFKFEGSKFPLGMLVMTRGVADLVAEDPAFAAFAYQSLKRHASGDWGDLCEEDKKENEYALNKYLRIFSAYEQYPLPKIWIITEADRSVTTTLFPDEY